MPIDVTSIGVRSDPTVKRWTSADANLYALAVGAGGIDPAGHELAFTTDDSAGIRPRVLPTFALVIGSAPEDWHVALGDVDPSGFLHAGQELVCHREIPPSGEVEWVWRVAELWDKGTAALVKNVSEGRLVDDGELLFTTASSILMMGAGGFGGERGPSRGAGVVPDRAPDVEVTYQTRPEQALLYRLTGDRARHNSDPKVAAEAGFERPILHGMCTYGFAGRALLHELCDSDPGRFGSMSCRFASPVFPGEALRTRMWDLGDSWAFTVAASDDRVVLGDGRFTRRDG